MYVCMYVSIYLSSIHIFLSIFWEVSEKLQDLYLGMLKIKEWIQITFSRKHIPVYTEFGSKFRHHF